MDALLQKLLDLTSSPDWPDQWMYPTQIRDELDRLGFWGVPPLSDLTEAQRLEWLETRLRSFDDERFPYWVRIGGEYKHPRRMTEEDWLRKREWRLDFNAAILETMRRVQMGEALPSRPKKLQPPILTNDAFIAQTQEAFEELRRLNLLLNLVPQIESRLEQPDQSAAQRAGAHFGFAAVLSYVAGHLICEADAKQQPYPDEYLQVRRLATQVIELYQNHVPDSARDD